MEITHIFLLFFKIFLPSWMPGCKFLSSTQKRELSLFLVIFYPAQIIFLCMRKTVKIPFYKYIGK